jgi:hypothetical protein
MGMITMISTFISLLSFRFRSRAGLELELVALRHQVAVLRRQRKGRVQLFSTDRLLWVWLYRIWPQALNAMVLVKPSTVARALRADRIRVRSTIQHLDTTPNLPAQRLRPMSSDWDD